MLPREEGQGGMRMPWSPEKESAPVTRRRCAAATGPEAPPAAAR